MTAERSSLARNMSAPPLTTLTFAALAPEAGASGDASSRNAFTDARSAAMRCSPESAWNTMHATTAHSTQRSAGSRNAAITDENAWGPAMSALEIATMWATKYTSSATPVRRRRMNITLWIE